MPVEIVGDGPAVTAVRAALSDVGVDAESVAVDALGDPHLAVVVGDAGEPTLDRANERALETGLRWIAVELGGVGGYPVVEASIAGFGPDTACYACLAGRIEANVDPDAEPTAAQPAHTARYAGAVAGRAAARYLEAGDPDVFGTVREVPYAERTLLPVPNCECASADEVGLSLEGVDRDLEASLARAERGLDGRVGIVREVGEAESVPAPYYLARVCDTGGFSDATAARDAAGVAAGWDAAFMKALGEGFERYAAGVYRADTFETGTADAVTAAVPPASFVCRTDPTGEESIGWVQGRDLRADEVVRLPAEFVHYPPPNERFRPAVTTGLGLGNDGVEAVLAGLYEVIERDATMLAWYSSFEPMGLDVEDEVVADLTRRARTEDLSVTVLLLTQDVDVPVLGAAVHRETWPQFALGSAAALDPSRAARSALAEALQNWMELRGMGPEGAEDAGGAIGQYAAAPESVADFAAPETTVPATAVGPADPPTGRDELDAVLERLAAADLAAYAAPTTTRDLRSLGFEAVRVLVPAAQPLFFGDAFFGERAASVPTELGFEPRLERDHHPFP